MAEPETITTHESDAIARLPEHAAEEADVIGLFAARTQLLENLFQDLLQQFDIEQATGIRLDYWGRLVGEKREGLVDAQYRRALSARLLARRSKGQAEDLIEITRLCVQPLRVRLYEARLPLVRIEYVVQSAVPAVWRTKLLRLLRDAKGVGVPLQVVEGVAKVLGFEAGDAITEGFSQGRLAQRID